ncbi:MAG: methyl-accepting chemotaxis protein, partial [Betaproteobacteria bacterium]
AARAGEAGRGFAVVADEVRKLAERTTLATAEIAKVTGSIHQRAEQAVDAMAEAVEQVELGAALSTQAGAAISDIRSSSERVVEVVRQITDALSESSAASQNMANQTERVARVAEESDHGAQVSAQAASNLEKLTGEMRNMVGRFRI